GPAENWSASLRTPDATTNTQTTTATTKDLITDPLLVGRGHVRNGALCFMRRSSLLRREVALPFGPEDPAELQIGEMGRDGDRVRGLHLLVERFARARRELGVDVRHRGPLGVLELDGTSHRVAEQERTLVARRHDHADVAEGVSGGLERVHAGRDGVVAGDGLDPSGRLEDVDHRLRELVRFFRPDELVEVLVAEPNRGVCEERLLVPDEP